MRIATIARVGLCSAFMGALMFFSASAAYGPSAAAGEPLNCNLTGYKPALGLAAVIEGSVLALTWDGDKSDEVRLRLTINGGTPTIRDVGIKRKGASWSTVASNVVPEFRVVSGYRRLDQEAYPALKIAFAG